MKAAQIGWTRSQPRTLYLFGQFMEHKHNTSGDGLLAELLQHRKFEEGSWDGNGVSTGRVQEEKVQDRYWELLDAVV